MYTWLAEKFPNRFKIFETDADVSAYLHDHPEEKFLFVVNHPGTELIKIY